MCRFDPCSEHWRYLSSPSRRYVLSKEEGGRHTPFFNGDQLQFFFGTVNVTGTNNGGLA